MNNLHKIEASLNPTQVKPEDVIELHHQVAITPDTFENLFADSTITFDDLCNAIGRRLVELGYIPSEGEDS